MNGLNHNALTCSAVPIPPWERPLQTVEAQPYFNVSQASLVLEGIVFDRNNNLLFVDVATGRVFKLTPERQLSSASLSEKSSELIAVERCSGFVAPMIGAVMTDFDNSQAIAT